MTSKRGSKNDPKKGVKNDPKKGSKMTPHPPWVPPPKKCQNLHWPKMNGYERDFFKILGVPPPTPPGGVKNDPKKGVKNDPKKGSKTTPKTTPKTIKNDLKNGFNARLEMVLVYH
jgi:hypothetical protein